MFEAAPDRYAFETALRGVAVAMAQDDTAPVRAARAEADIAAAAAARPTRSRAHLRLVGPA